MNILLELDDPVKRNGLSPLTERKQWVNWKYEERKGKLTKVPYIGETGQRASSTDPSTWCSFDAALANVEGYDGVGFAFIEDDDLTRIDLDHCRNPVTGEIEPWAKNIIALCNSYTEISPSQTGVKIWIGGKVEVKHYKGGNLYNLPTNDSRRMEVFVRGKYFTFTGDHLEGTPHRVTYNKEVPELLPHIGEILKYNNPKKKTIEHAFELWSNDYPDEQRSEPLFNLGSNVLVNITKGDRKLIRSLADTCVNSRWHEADEAWKEAEIERWIAKAPEKAKEQSTTKQVTARKQRNTLSLQEIVDLPPLKLLDEELKVPEKSIVLHYGESGSYKSFFALQQVALPLAQKGKRILYVMGESASTYGERVLAWCIANNCGLDGLAIQGYDAPIYLLQDQDISQVIEEMKDFNPDVIIVDTLSTSTAGDGDENAAKDMQHLMMNVDRIRSELECTVWLVHHAGKNGEYRGSSVLYAHADMVVKQTKAKKDEELDLEDFNIAFSGIAMNSITVEYPKWKGYPIKKQHFNVHVKHVGERSSIVLSSTNTPLQVALTKRQDAILNAIKARGSSSTAQIIEDLAGSYQAGSIKNELGKLVQKGVVSKEGRGSYQVPTSSSLEKVT